MWETEGNSSHQGVGLSHISLGCTFVDRVTQLKKCSKSLEMIKSTFYATSSVRLSIEHVHLLIGSILILTVSQSVQFAGVFFQYWITSVAIDGLLIRLPIQGLSGIHDIQSVFI